ncbi:MAG: hypothetical protein JW809_08915 [Pirellulales bacterium]|nr:hypothetical protein [Pirellulales bacterium]
MLAILVLPGVPRAADPDWQTLPFTPFSQMQAVYPLGHDLAGYPSWQMPTPPPDETPAYRIRGVVLNAPADMLDAAADYQTGPLGYMGGQWQVFIQAVALDGDETNCPELAGDVGGTALWMGQNYGNRWGIWGTTGYELKSYSNDEWNAELERINYPIDLATGEPVTEPLRPGDVIEVRARGGKAYGGKFNCNEEHLKTSLKDFDVYLIERDHAVESTTIALDDVMATDGAFLFDFDRGAGAELYQARYVTLEGVTIDSSAETWTADGRALTVTDSGARSLTIWLGHNPAFNTATMPTGTLNVTGIFNQESGSGDPTVAYSLWAMTPWEFVPADPLPGDADNDGAVNEADAATLAAHWLQASGAGWFDGDFNGDRAVDDLDLAILAANWGSAGSPGGAVPEPTAVALALAGLMTWTIARRRPR